MLSLRVEKMVRWLWSWLKRMRQVADWCFRAVIVKVALAPWIKILLNVLLYINQFVGRARIHLLLGSLLLDLRHIKLHPFVAYLLRLHSLRSRWYLETIWELIIDRSCIVGYPHCLCCGILLWVRWVLIWLNLWNGLCLRLTQPKVLRLNSASVISHLQLL